MSTTESFSDLRDIPGVTHRLVTANGVRLHVAEAGSGEPVMLLHGWPQHWWMWRKVIPALAERYRVIVPDLRGSGWSEAPKPRPGEHPSRSTATMHLYRTFFFREVPAVALGRYVSGRLTVPTRLLFGADDPVVLRSVVEADHSRRADDLSVRIVENCGHFIVDEQPELVTEELLQWFDASNDVN
ncbi:MAG: alpha/beta fold hydrolase [Solirubrobacterales bacterium]